MSPPAGLHISQSFVAMLCPSHLLCELEGFVSFCVSMIVLTLMSAHKGGFYCDVTHQSVSGFEKHYNEKKMKYHHQQQNKKQQQ